MGIGNRFSVTLEPADEIQSLLFCRAVLIFSVNYRNCSTFWEINSLVYFK